MLNYLKIVEYKSYKNFFVVKFIPELNWRKKIKQLFTKKREYGRLLLLPVGSEYEYHHDDTLYDQLGKGDVVEGYSFKRDSRWVFALNQITNETFFDDIPEINNLASNLEKALDLKNIEKAELERVIPFIKNQRIAHEILQELMEKYGYKRKEKVEVHAKRCAGDPTSRMEPLYHAIFCYVGEAFYKGAEASLYKGRQIAYIEFEGWDLLHALVKEKVLPNISQKESRKEQDN
ncbi:MAG: hypothetical protein KAT43_02420 [Nanoarchaeota archaeon]|nr:hypothetical protein [Nanoarchaeota archaeon]